MVSFPFRASFRLFLAVTLVLACQLTAGAQAPSKTGAKKTPVAEKTPTTAPKGSEKASAKETEAATPEAAAKVLDLRTIPLMEGAKVGSFRTLGMLMYEAKGTPKVAFN